MKYVFRTKITLSMMLNLPAQQRRDAERVPEHFRGIVDKLRHCS